MSTLKVTNLQHPSAASANVTLDSSGNADFNGKNLAGVASVNGSQLGGNRNIVINGAMTIQQRGTQTNQTSGYTACDRWNFAENGSTIITTTQDTNVPSGKGFGSSLKIDVTTASGTPAAANYAFLRTKFEGQDLQNICKGTSEAKQLTLSFWVSSPKTGTHIAELFDLDNSRQVSKAYTIDTANTWQYVSIVFPADTTGSFDNDNASSLQLVFWLMAGSNQSSGTLNTSWAATVSADRAVGQVNVMDDVANNFYLTGVQLEVGDTATDFEHESVGTTLQKAQRYFYRVAEGTANALGIGANYSATYMLGAITFPVTMRAIPTLDAASGTNYYEFVRNSAADYFHSLTLGNRTTNKIGEIFNNTDISGTVGQAGWIRTDNAAVYVDFDAEL